MAETRYPEVLRLKGPKGMSWALDAVAARELTSRSELVRRWLRQELESRGLQLAEPARERTDTYADKHGMKRREACHRATHWVPCLKASIEAHGEPLSCPSL